jgi:type I restriction enzyme R subunit
MDDNVIAHAFHHNAFLVVSNGDNARYGSITSGWEHFAEWKRQDEKDNGSVAAQCCLDGMLAHERLLDIVENFILFDESKAGADAQGGGAQTTSAGRQPGRRLRGQAGSASSSSSTGERCGIRVVTLPLERSEPARKRRPTPRPPRGGGRTDAAVVRPTEGPIDIVERAIPIWGGSACFWHTQGSGKSYSMAFFAEKVRRKVPGNFTFLLMTDRDDLDDQIYGTFVGCGIADAKTPRAASGRHLEKLLKENHDLRLQPDPQVQPGRVAGRALQRARRHHRRLRRGAPHASRAAGAQHAAGTAERRLHRLHRHAAVQAGPDYASASSATTCRATISSALRKTARR